MDCVELTHKLRNGEPLSPTEREHAAQCDVCGPLSELVPQLPSSPPEANTDLTGLLEQTEARIEHDRGLRARLRALPSHLRLGATALAVLLLPLVVALFSRRPPDPLYPTARWLALGTAYAGFALLLAARTIRGPHRAERPVAGLLALFGLSLVLEPILPVPPTIHPLLSERFVAEGLGCFVYGVLTGAPLAVWVAWLDRRDRLGGGRLWLAGAAGGAAGLASLAFHCRLSAPTHLLAGHSTAAAVLAAGTALALSLATRRSRAQSR